MAKPISVELLAITPEPEKLIEEAGRTCYLSFDKMQEQSEKNFIRRLIKLGHDSPLEHAYATFRICNCSRAMTHQLVRHRLASFSQQSQRYVSEDNFEYVTPPGIAEEFLQDYHNDMEIIRKMYAKWRNRNVLREDARFVLPNACVSEIVVSANFRQWRHIIELRTSPKAQWEIRQVCLKIVEILKQHAPACFEEYPIDDSNK